MAADINRKRGLPSNPIIYPHQLKMLKVGHDLFEKYPDFASGEMIQVATEVVENLYNRGLLPKVSDNNEHCMHHYVIRFINQYEENGIPIHDMATQVNQLAHSEIPVPLFILHKHAYFGGYDITLRDKELIAIKARPAEEKKA